MDETRNSYEIFLGKSLRKWSLGSQGRRWKNSIEMDLREIGCGDGR
jgi:hypothetical protein